MGNIINKWIKLNEDEHGHYAAFVGFEEEINNYSELLGTAYDKLDISEQIELFGFIVDLLDREKEK